MTLSGTPILSYSSAVMPFTAAGESYQLRRSLNSHIITHLRTDGKGRRVARVCWPRVRRVPLKSQSQTSSRLNNDDFFAFVLGA